LLRSLACSSPTPLLSSFFFYSSAPPRSPPSSPPRPSSVLGSLPLVLAFSLVVSSAFPLGAGPLIGLSGLGPEVTRYARQFLVLRSEERRVGKEGRDRGAPYPDKKEGEREGAGAYRGGTNA